MSGFGARASEALSSPPPLDFPFDFQFGLPLDLPDFVFSADGSAGR